MAEKDDKLIPLDALAERVAEARGEGLRVAHSHGFFNLLLPMQIKHLEDVRRSADLLVVTLVPDEGTPISPRWDAAMRALSLTEIPSVDYVAIGRPGLADTVRSIGPDIFAPVEQGTEVGELGSLDVEVVGAAEAAASVPPWVESFNVEAKEYLAGFRRRHPSREVVQRLRDLQSIRVLLVGDAIIDEYHYCKAVGKSSKSATLTARYLSAERHAGGVLAAANHVAGFANEVRLLTFIGDSPEEEKFIRGSLRENVRSLLIEAPERQTVVKRRYVDPFQISKMFEVMWLDNEEEVPSGEEELLGELETAARWADLVLVADFGHGAVTSRMVESLTREDRDYYLAINTQTNSANQGYNLITKYPRADYICIDEEEMRLANHSRCGDLETMVNATARGLGCRLATVTRGAQGSLTWSEDGTWARTPVFSKSVVDSVGAGDAYLSVSSLAAQAGLPPDLVGFVGNCTGGLAVHIVGNRKPVDPPMLFRFIRHLL